MICSNYGFSAFQADFGGGPTPKNRPETLKWLPQATGRSIFGWTEALNEKSSARLVAALAPPRQPASQP